MKKTIVFVAIILILCMAFPMFAGAETVTAGGETKTIFDVANLTTLTEGMAINGGSLHRLRGASNTLENKDGEQLIKMVTNSDKDETANRIELGFTALDVTGYQYLRFRVINASDYETIKVMLGFEGTAWLGYHYYTVDKDGTLNEEFNTFFPILKDGFDGYVYIDLGVLIRQGDAEPSRREATDTATLQSTSHTDSFFNPQAVTAFNIRICHEVGEVLYFGNFELCNAVVAEDPTPTPVPTPTPTPEPTATPTEAPTVAPTEISTDTPTVAPTVEPTVAPTVAPTTAEPAAEASASGWWIYVGAGLIVIAVIAVLIGKKKK